MVKMIANELVHIFFHRRAYCVICTWNSFMTLFADDAVYVICKMHIADEKTHLTVSINVILHCGHKGNYHVICRIFRHFFLSQHSLNSWHLSEQFSVPLQLFLANFCTILVLLAVFQRYASLLYSDSVINLKTEPCFESFLRSQFNQPS